MRSNTAYVWKKLAGYYGSRLVEMYGEKPPEDWEAQIERLDRRRLDDVLSKIRTLHPVHPPTFPQFEKLCQRPIDGSGRQSPAEKLCQYIIDNKLGTSEQIMSKWKWLADSDGIISGVVLPAVEGANSRRIMMADMYGGVTVVA